MASTASAGTCCDTRATCCASLTTSFAYLTVRGNASTALCPDRPCGSFLRCVCPAAASSWGSGCSWLWSVIARSGAPRRRRRRRRQRRRRRGRAPAWLFSGAAACRPAYHCLWCSRVVLPPPRLGRPAAAPRWRSPAVHDGSGLLRNATPPRATRVRSSAAASCRCTGAFVARGCRTAHCGLARHSPLSSGRLVARQSPGGGGLVSPRCNRHAPRFRRVWKPGIFCFFLPSVCSTKGALTPTRAVSLTARLWLRRESPPFPLRIFLPVGSGRKPAVVLD